MTKQAALQTIQDAIKLNTNLYFYNKWGSDLELMMQGHKVNNLQDLLNSLVNFNN